MSFLQVITSCGFCRERRFDWRFKLMTNQTRDRFRVRLCPGSLQYIKHTLAYNTRIYSFFHLFISVVATLPTPPCERMRPRNSFFHCSIFKHYHFCQNFLWLIQIAESAASATLVFVTSVKWLTPLRAFPSPMVKIFRSAGILV